MKIEDLRIGMKVQRKLTKFPMDVVGIFYDGHKETGGGCVYLDFEGNEGDVWEENVCDIELSTE